MLRLLTGGNVRTLDQAGTVAQAIALDGDRIVAIGTDDEIRALGGAREDLAGRTVIPGLIDAHNHLQMTGRVLDQVQLFDCRSIAEIVERVADALRDAAAGHVGARARLGREPAGRAPASDAPRPRSGLAGASRSCSSASGTSSSATAPRCARPGSTANARPGRDAVRRLVRARRRRPSDGPLPRPREGADLALHARADRGRLGDGGRDGVPRVQPRRPDRRLRARSLAGADPRVPAGGARGRAVGARRHDDGRLGVRHRGGRGGAARAARAGRRADRASAATGCGWAASSCCPTAASATARRASSSRTWPSPAAAAPG